MYESYDPRSRLSPQAAAKPAAAATGFAAAEYVKFGALPPAETTRGSRTWYGRGQNFVVAYSEVEPGARFERRGQKDEYMLFLPEQGEGARIEAGGEAVDIPGYTLAIVPPGDSVVTLRQAGVLVRVFSAVNADLAEKAANADGYATAHPHIPPYRTWPEPPGGYRIRHYSLDVPPQPGRFGRLFRCTTMMINVLPYEPDPRDITRLSPHHHDDFEQGSLALKGAFVHHIRWPWVADQRQWREDDHEHCPAPSLAVIPPPAIHTSAATEKSGNQLVDIFAPPRMDFSKMPGWVLNADEYPMPEAGG
ncbi:MAG: hypothetical protein DIU62_004085 [Pseudomonadota bacterium]|jgi:hypothetical protein|nr:MAG: hypothetical protein DIU62_01820 [Pseudomonadota bacterium]